MRRETRSPRAGWKQKVERLGLTFHTVDDEPYWNESAAYRFDSEEIALLESSTNELHEMCLAAVEELIAKGDLGRLSIPEAAHPVIAHYVLDAYIWQVNKKGKEIRAVMG